MTEEQKLKQLALLEMKARIAERNNLPATAQWWREAYENVRKKPASEMILTKEHDMEDINEVFSGESLKAIDLQGKEPVVTIESVTPKEFSDNGKASNKLVITFVGKQKALICNKTNASRIALMHGTKFRQWVGKKIQLYTDIVDFQGKAVEAIRVRPVKSAAAAPKPVEEVSFNDSVEDIGATF